jgi:hypothetical protein
MEDSTSISGVLDKPTWSTSTLFNKVDDWKLNTQLLYPGSFHKRALNGFGSKNQLFSVPSPARISSSFKNTTSSQIISKLFQATFEFWSIIVNQDSWALRFPPRPLVNDTVLDGADSCMEDIEETTLGKI